MTYAAHPFPAIFAQLRALRKLIEELEEAEKHSSLRGHQTVDSPEAIRLSFDTLSAGLSDIETTLATIAEAMGEIRKF
jgi:hypothetical protein